MRARSEEEKMLKKTNTLAPGEIIPLTDDNMFTEIFNDKDNLCVLEEFIASYFSFDLEKVRGNIQIKSRHLNKETLVESNKSVDLLLEYENKKYNIEMSTGWNQGIRDRNTVFLSNIHGKQLSRGFNSYEEIESSIQINLNAFNCEENVKASYYLRNETGKIFSKKFRIDVIDMEKGRKMCYTNNEKMNEIIKWCKVFMSKTKKELNNALNEIVSTKSKEKLYSNVSRLSGDEVMVKKYIGKSKWEMAMESVLEERIESRLKPELEEKLKPELEEKLKPELEEKLKPQLEEKLKPELEEKLKPQLESKLKSEYESKYQSLEQEFSTRNIGIVSNMKKKHIDVNTISEITGLSIQEIEKIK
jgi:hypothetical protein